MKKKGKTGLGIILVLVAAFLYYYITLPAINIHASGFWIFIFVLCAAIFAAIYGGLYKKRGVPIKKVKLTGIIVLGAILAIFLIGSLLSSPIVNAKKYQQLMAVEERNFTEDIQEISFNEIPLLDKDSATVLGQRKMGSLVDMVSQFEVSDLYTQINFQESPYRVTPLRYANTIKWLTNSGDGIPAYIRINMATQDVECIILEQGMKYTPFDHFNRNLKRHLRFNFPTYIFDDPSFEIDDTGTPYWICPVKQYNIGLFGGVTIGRVVLVNAITGELQDYAVEEAPTWIDRVYSADLLVGLYDYYGTLKHGFFNSVLGQKDCLQTTEGYNYIALDDDVWVYTGVTSVSGDQSIVGFVLMNQRTMETRYYVIPGAKEYSAMDSAQGQVQHLGYEATFPLLLNIADEPTYFMALKDNAGLVKMYAMVNIEKYTIVAVGNSVQECEKTYIELMNSNGIQAEPSEGTGKTITGSIERIAEAVIDGNSHYYLMLSQSKEIFDIPVKDFVQVIRYSVGDTITLDYYPGEMYNLVTNIQE
ncbi:CvpA family protein [Bianquea renquensis]|jgi:hypothetical protein|uniref:CvpA family protein n=1 Tax=Bianquea renquensis TaxID=2763661 RepID=A0A926I0Q4_9FIRM|nr:CvpA family protein [Bianquea renquensis]MBC8542166.1 CvpA family protein [Bianquea renquensis]